MIKRICAYGECAKEFSPRKKTSRYCGNECYIACRESLKRSALQCGRADCNEIAKHPNIYCSQSCAATVNNVKHPKRSRRAGDPTLTYAGQTPSGRRRYRKRCQIEDCTTLVSTSAEHCREHHIAKVDSEAKSKIKDWLIGGWSGGTDKRLSSVIRVYLLEQSGYTCTGLDCGFNTPHPDDGKTILEVDHINGDGTDHSPENLRVLCPNCHALTSTYRGRNIGSGRPVSYIRQAKEQAPSDGF